jgi:hypothetical protein
MYFVCSKTHIARTMNSCRVDRCGLGFAWLSTRPQKINYLEC